MAPVADPKRGWRTGAMGAGDCRPADALKEWGKLDPTIRIQFKKKLAERLHNPRGPAAQLAGR